MQKIKLLIILFSSFCFGAQAQTDLAVEEHVEELKNSVKFVLSHTYVPKGREVGDGDDLLILPSLGLEYNYKLKPRLTIGGHVEVEIMNYVLEPKNDTVITRDYPIISAVMLQYEVIDGLWFGLGPGYEIERNKNLWVAKFSLEYEFETKNHISFGPQIGLDVKEVGTSSYSFGLNIGKGF